MKNSSLAIDPNVKVPSAVMRHANRADEVQKAHLAALNGEADPQPDPQQPDPQPQSDPQPDPQPQSDPQPAPPQPDPQPSAAADDENAESWKRKFESAQGRINHLNGRLKAYDERFEGMERLIASLQSAPPAPAAEEPPKKFVTDDDVATYGAEFFEAVERKAQELIAPLKSQLEGQLTQLGSQVNGVAQRVQKDARQTMKDHLNDNVPNWLALNEDSEFIEWLDGFDPLTGVKRQSMLLQAWENNDGPRVANFFKLFLREQDAIKSDDTPPEGARPTAPTVSLGAFAAPGKAKTAPSPKDAPARQPITRKYIAEFYADVNTGKYRNNPQGKEQIERDIFAAQAEGRIQP